MENYLEKYIEDINYNDLDKWCIPNINNFSESKQMYDYQVNAIKNAIKTLYSYYKYEDWTKKFYEMLKNKEIIKDEYDVKLIDSKEKNSFQKNRRYELFSNYYKIADNNSILGYQFFNRMCFWMATGSGKTIVIIKLIEAINYLQAQKLLPQYDIMILFPREDLIQQFKKEVNDYNKSKQNKINLINLKEYDERKYNYSLFNNIDVYYYRSDLIRDNKTENCVDYKNYLNNGKWFVLLDEAHRGEKETSLLQDYVAILSSHGFLFNFSATFTERIDYLTTCYNFNLEKFINSGYGKNIYLNKSYFNFKQNNLEYTNDEKKKQVLKSLIILAFEIMTKKENYYHNPLLMTLVNSVNTDDSDLLLFFKKVEEIASGKIDEKILEEAKDDLIEDFNQNKEYMFGNEKIDFDYEQIRKISLSTIFKLIFNSKTNGKIQLIKGESGKEYALQLETSDSPFALIKIGDADKFQKEKLGNNYILINSFENNKSFFKELNSPNSSINMLIGSRSFYEGWDSNRPNVINLINIGGKDAKKYVLQSIGRGIRIEPTKGYRKRLNILDANRCSILETLFVFATNKSDVRAILEAIENEKTSSEYTVSLEKNNNIPFELLVPEYIDKETQNVPMFNLSRQSLDKFEQYFQAHSKELMMVKYCIDTALYDKIKRSLEKKEEFYQINEIFKYEKIDILTQKIIEHFNISMKVVSKIDEVDENTIVHFKNIKLIDF